MKRSRPREKESQGSLCIGATLQPLPSSSPDQRPLSPCHCLPCHNSSGDTEGWELLERQSWKGTERSHLLPTVQIERLALGNAASQGRTEPVNHDQASPSCPASLALEVSCAMGSSGSASLPLTGRMLATNKAALIKISCLHKSILQSSLTSFVSFKPHDRLVR